MTGTNTAESSSVDAAEVNRFAENAEDWWDRDGPYRPLHQLNPLRIAYVRDRFCDNFGRDAKAFDSLRGLRILDIGCGGGLLCEPLARLGAEVVGADAAEENVHIARHHAEAGGLKIDYVRATAEELAEWGEKFDAIVNMEVVEHVADAELFLGACADLLKPGGAMALATLNRTLKSYALAIVGAEYVLRWLPRGTHRWQRFLRPSELARHLRAAGLTVSDLTGVAFDPLDREWRLSRDLGVNYMAFAVKAGGFAVKAGA